MKDNENYNLTSLGFIQDFEKEISFLLELSQDLPMTTFSAWKHQLLNTYYAERQFPAFVQSNINVPLFIENIYSKAQNMVETKYWKESPAEVNTYIAAFKDSLAYLLPRDLFLKYYHYYFTTDLRLNPRKNYTTTASKSRTPYFPSPAPKYWNTSRTRTPYSARVSRNGSKN